MLYSAKSPEAEQPGGVLSDRFWVYFDEESRDGYLKYCIAVTTFHRRR